MVDASQKRFAIGGLGGSGTRTVAAVLMNLGFYIGDDLNTALDNLWFTLLFKRRAVLLESDAVFSEYFDFFKTKMNGLSVSSAAKIQILSLAAQDRLQHSQQWLMERATTLMAQTSTRQKNQPWAWKEPNTHIVVDRLLQLDPALVYIHVVRDPRYMVGSKNINQIENWAPVFFSNDDPVSAQRTLAYWCAVHLRLQQIETQFCGRVIFLNYDQFCLSPAKLINDIFTRQGFSFDVQDVEKACQFVQASGSARPDWPLSTTNQDDRKWAENFYVSI